MSPGKRFLAIGVAVALAMLAGWWLGRGLAPRDTANSDLPALLLVESVHFSWWSCPTSSAGPHNIYIFSIPLRLTYQFEVGNRQPPAEKSDLVVRPEDFRLVSAELPENYREALSAAAAIGNAESELAAELARARPIAGYLAAFLLQDPESPLRPRLAQQLHAAVMGLQRRAVPSSRIVWAGEDKAFPEAARNRQAPPFGITPCPQRNILAVDGVAYFMRPEGLLRADRTEGLLAQFGEVQLTPSAIAQAPELRQAVELMEAALQRHREAQQVLRAVNEEELAMRAESSVLESRREAIETEYLAAMDAEDETRMREVEQQQLLLDEEYDQLQLRMDAAQQRQIDAGETSALASQQVKLAQQYAQNVAQTRSGIVASVPAGRGSAPYAGRLYLIEGYF